MRDGESRSLYGFRHDPMEFVRGSRSIQAAMARTFLFKEPKEGDREMLSAAVEKVLEKQNEDGSFGEDDDNRPTTTGAELLWMLRLGAAADHPGVTKTVGCIREQPFSKQGWAGAEGKMSCYSLESFCLLGLTDFEQVLPSTKKYIEDADGWMSPGCGCPWTPAVHLRALWHARQVNPELEGLVEEGLRRILDRMNDAGCIGYNDPWGFLDCAGCVDLPLAKAIVEKQIPMILRGQREDGGWGDHSYVVLRALASHDLLEPLRKLPPLPPDWKTVAEIPAPGQGLFSLTWDGERLWTRDRRTNEVVAVSPEDGAVLKRLKLNVSNACGIAWWDGALAVTQSDPKRLLRVDPETGAVLKEVALDHMDDVIGLAKVNGSFWIGDGFMCTASVVNPDTGENRWMGIGACGPIDGAFDGEGVWFCHFWAPVVTRSALDGKLMEWGEAPLGGNCNGLAWDGKRLWALDAKGGRICAIQRATRQ